MRKVLLGLALLAPSAAFAQQSITMPSGSPTVGYPVTTGDGQRQPIQAVTLTDASGNPVSSGGTPTGTAGSPNAAVVTVQGITGGTPQATYPGLDVGGTRRALCTSSAGALCAPTTGTANSTGTVTAVAASTSTTVCPATTNPVVYEVQTYGTAPVLLGLDGQTLSSITPAAGSGAYMLLPTQYTLYVGPVARTNIITAYTATAQTVVCNIVTRQ